MVGVRWWRVSMVDVEEEAVLCLPEVVHAGSSGGISAAGVLAT